jgi:hypothetical protein
MVHEIAAFVTQRVLGIPLIVYGGVFTFFCFLVTGTIAFLTMHGIKRFPLNWHTRMAYFSISLALLHGGIALLIYL